MYGYSVTEHNNEFKLECLSKWRGIFKMTTYDCHVSQHYASLKDWELTGDSHLPKHQSILIPAVNLCT